MARPKVLLVDDHAMFRNGIRLVFESSGEFDVCAEASDGQQALDALEAVRPELVVLDLHLPGAVSGKQVARSALQREPPPAVVIVTMHHDVAHLKQMLEVGVRGYLLKESNAEALLSACRSALAGSTFVDPALTEHMVTAFVGKRPRFDTPDQAKLASLTKRERQVLRLVTLGYTNAEIASKLEISKRTVETHRRQIMNKLDFSSRAQLMRFALEVGVVKPF